MELKDLKSTWNKLASENVKNKLLPEDEFRKIIKNRTLDISDKIGRNIRIGVALILAWVCFWFAVDFISSPLMGDPKNKPYLTDDLMLWTFIIESIIYVLVIASIIIFWIRYNKIEKNKTDTTNLKSKLTQLIQILTSYRKMFYIVLWIILLYTTIIFSSGFILEYSYQIKEAGLNFGNLKFINWLIVALAFLVSIAVISAIYYIPFNFFFKRLYGKYLKQLKATLLELTEPSSFDN